MSSPYPYQPPPRPVYAETASRAKTALWLGLASLLCCGLFTGIPAIFIGVRALNEIEIERGRLTGKGLAWTGIVLGIVGTLGSLAVGGYRATH
jgi:hypothetical protein